MVHPTCPSQKKISGGQREEGHGVVHHFQQEHHQNMKEVSNKKVQKVSKFQNGPHYLSVKKNLNHPLGLTLSTPSLVSPYLHPCICNVYTLLYAPKTLPYGLFPYK